MISLQVIRTLSYRTVCECLPVCLHACSQDIK